MKLYCFIAIIGFAIVATLLSSSDATNSTWGYVGPYDRLLLRQFVIEKSHMFRVVTRDVIYPPRNHISQYSITAVKAIDKDRRNGGYGYLMGGGPGHRNVTLHLKSQRGHGLNFIVEVYGR